MVMATMEVTEAIHALCITIWLQPAECIDTVVADLKVKRIGK